MIKATATCADGRKLVQQMTDALRGRGDKLCSDAAGEIERLRALIEDTVETLEAMGLHVDNPLYNRLRAALDGQA